MKREKKSLTREQRQIRYIPIVVAVIATIIYVFNHLRLGDPFLHESLFGFEYQWELSRYTDIAMIYLASVIFVILCQKDSGLELFETFFINLVLLAITGLIVWLTNLTFLPALIVVFGLAWGLMYSNAIEIGRNLLMLFVVLTIFVGLVNAFIIGVITLVPIAIAFYLRLMTAGSDFRRFVFWLGLSPSQEYEPIKDEASSPSPSLAAKSETAINQSSAEVKSGVAIDLSSDPEEVVGFTVKRHRPGRKDFQFIPEKCSLYLSFVQKQNGGVSGAILAEDPLIKNRSFNANLLDWLLVNQEWIPTDWKNYSIPFWDTIYERNNIEHVRCMVWTGNKFASEIRWLTRNFDDKYRTLVADK